MSNDGGEPLVDDALAQSSLAVDGHQDPTPNGHPAAIDPSKVRIPGVRRLWLPDVDRQFIRDSLHREDCEARVVAFHRSLFHSRYAGDVEQTVQGRDLLDRHVQELEARNVDLARQVARTRELVRHEQDGSGGMRWSAFDRVLAAGLGLFSLVLLGMGLNTLAVYFIDSGFLLFVERPVLAYLFSALNVCLAILLKVGYSWCRDDVARRRYFVGLWAVGLVSGGLWLVTFAIIFPNLGTQGIDEIIGSLDEGTPWLDRALEGLFVWSQLISEICIAAALWIHLAQMVVERAPTLVMADNPEHRGYLRRLSESKEEVRAAVETRSILEGRLKEFQALESAYLAKALAAARAGRAVQQAGRFGQDANDVSARLFSGV